MTLAASDLALVQSAVKAAISELEEDAIAFPENPHGVGPARDLLQPGRFHCSVNGIFHPAVNAYFEIEAIGPGSIGLRPVINGVRSARVTRMRLFR